LQQFVEQSVWDEQDVLRTYRSVLGEAFDVIERMLGLLRERSGPSSANLKTCRQMSNASGSV